MSDHYDRYNGMDKLGTDLAQLGTNLAEVGTNLISKEQAINALGELATFTEDWSCHTWMYTDDVYNAIKQLPPIQPKKGRWNTVGMADAVGGESAMWGSAIAYHVCSKCFEQAMERDGEEVLSNFCPNCGADMRGEQDG